MASTRSITRLPFAVASAVVLAIAGLSIVGLAAPASAQSADGAQPPIDHRELGGDLYKGEDLPPGVRGPYSPFADRERTSVRPFGDVSEGRHTEFSPINEFAGQTIEFEQGLIAEQLGRLKETIIDEISDVGGGQAPE